MSTSVSLHTLLDGMADTGAFADTEISGLNLDSRQVCAGDAFVALHGTRQHGIDFAPAAMAKGAAAVLAETPAPAQWQGSPSTLWVDDLSQQLGEIAARYFAHPGIGMHIVGVTGTNGKTSVVSLLAQALAGLDRRSASIGTLGAGLYAALQTGERTTPDAIHVQALLAKFQRDEVSHVAMEVSSHALVQGRVNAVPFEVAVFTNLSRDHLDYHGSMDAYGAAKARLFAWPGLRAAVINVDDSFGRDLAAGLSGSLQRLRYGLGDNDAEIAASNVVCHDQGVDFDLRTPWGVARVRSQLIGRFNVSNLLAVVGCLGAFGVDFERICASLCAMSPVPGRMNRLGGGAAPLLVIDYAHTPDALAQALATLRAHVRGKLICVFGAGGDRDRGKRPEMGKVAENLADLLIVTDDNPRSESGDAIVAEILAGMAAPEHARIERDRGRAIALAVAAAQSGDVVLIAGKGHETYQEAGGERRAFDDSAVARAALEARA